MRKKFLLMMLTLLFVAMGSSGNLFAADGNVAKVGNTEYATIDEAIANWTANSTLTLLSDVTLSDVVTLNSTEHHYLNLSTYTMTAASGKNAIVIKACGNGSSEKGAITITADATNPGGINAGNKCVIYYKYADGGITKEDRPIIYIKGGVFTGSTSSLTGTAGIHTIGSEARKCATLDISGGTFNCSIKGVTKSKLLVSGGNFNYSVSSQGDSIALRLISGGRFKTLGFMTADDNNTKFWFGTSMANSNVGVYVDDEGYLVVGGPVITEAGTRFKASSTYSGWSSYLKYSSANANRLYYTSEEKAKEINKKMFGSGYNNDLKFHDPITLPSDLSNNDIAKELVSNTAIDNYSIELPNGVNNFYINIKEIDGENKIVFDVTPKNGQEEIHQPSSPITFRLPVPATWSGRAKVYHEGTAIGKFEIKNESEDKYIELASATFSEFAVELVISQFAGNGTVDSPYIIDSEGKLAALRDEVNGGESYEGVYFKLTENITLSGEWTAIGNGSRSSKSYTGKAFKGVFDGDNKTISGLTITSTTAADAAIGLFGVVDGGTVKNLNLTNVNINVSNSNLAGAAIGMMLNGATADNITVSGAIVGYDGVGGIVGRLIIDGTIANCTNNASVTSSYGGIGGIVGKAYYEDSSYTATFASITNCTNKGTIKAPKYVGGIAGLARANVSGCVNEGEIQGGTQTGGIIGQLMAAGTVSGNDNKAKVSGTSHVGGIIGDYTQSVSYTYNNVTIANNINRGEISATSTGGCAAILGCNNIDGFTDMTATGNLSYYYVEGLPLFGNPEDMVIDATNKFMIVVAKIGETPYYTLADAIAAAQTGDEIVIIADVELTETTDFPAGKTITLNLNNKKVSAADKNVVKNSGAALTIKNGTIERTGNVAGYAVNVVSGTLEVEDVTIVGGLYTSGSSLVATNTNINQPYSSRHAIYASNCAVTINSGEYHNDNAGNATIFAYGSSVITIEDGTFSIDNGKQTFGWTSCMLDANAGGKFVINGGTFKGHFRVQANSTMEITGGTFENTHGEAYAINGTAVVVVKGGTFTDAKAKAFATMYVSDDCTLDEDGKVVSVVAKIGETKYETLDAAVAAAKEGDKITLLNDADLAFAHNPQYNFIYASEIDLNGKTMTIKKGDIRFDNVTIKNGNIIVQPSTYNGTAIFLMYSKNLTFNDVKVTATGVAASAYLIGLEGASNLVLEESEIIVNNESLVNIGSIIADNGNGNTVTIKDSKIDIKNSDARLYLGGKNGNITVENSDIDLTGVKEGFYLRAGQTLAITGTSTVDITLNSNEGRYGINLTDRTATYTKAETATVNATVYEIKVAKVGENTYRTLALAVAAVEDGGTITLIANEIFTKNNRYNNGGWWDGLGYSGDKSFTIDLAGFTVSQDGSLNDYLFWFKNAGSKENTITIKNGTLDAGTTAFCALCTASSHDNQLTVNTENLTLINNNSNGSTVKVRAGSVLNVKKDTKITGKNSYLGIENWNATVNIYDGAEIYMNGTSSYNGCLVGVSGGGTVNVYGGYGKGVKGGFIAMTSGGTINVAGGEWIANTNGTVGNNSNLYVLTAQSNKYESGFAGPSIINVTGGTLRGGMDAWVLNNLEGEKAELNISGGNFNANPSAYVKVGYVATEAAGIYTVVEAPAYIEGKASYLSLAAAYEDAVNGDVIVLNESVTTFPVINKAVTFKGGKENAAVEINVFLAQNFTAIEGTVKFENLTFNKPLFTEQGGTKPGLTIEFESCNFNVPSDQGYAILIGTSWSNSVVKGLKVNKCNFKYVGTEFKGGYMLYVQCVNEVSITNNTIDGNNLYRGAIHLGDATEHATVAIVSNNTIKNFCRGVMMGNRKAPSSANISVNTFENINYSNKDSKPAQECAPIFIHSNATAEALEIALTDNIVTNCNNPMIYSEDTDLVADYVTEFTANTVNGTAVEFADRVSYNAPNQLPVVAKIGDKGYQSLQKAINAAVLMSGDITIEIMSGTYAEDIKLTNDAITIGDENVRPNITFKPVANAEVTLAGTTTLGYRQQNVGASMWNGKVTFDGIIFNHAEDGKHSLDIQDVKGIALNNCKVIGDGEYGIGSNGGNATTDATFTSCTFENGAMQVLGQLGAHLVVDNSIFTDFSFNVQGGATPGMTIKNSTFNMTLTDDHDGESFYAVRTNACPINIIETKVNVDSEVSSVAADQAKWGIFWARQDSDAKWNIAKCEVNLTDEAMAQPELLLTKNATTTYDKAVVRIIITDLTSTSNSIAKLAERTEGCATINGVKYLDGELDLTGMVAHIGEAYYATFADALAAVDNGQTITLIENVTGDEKSTEIEFTKDINFTITGIAPAYALPIVTFQNAEVTINNAEILIPELDARQNAVINIVNSTVHDAGGNSIAKSYYNGTINIDENSIVYMMQITTMGYINVAGTVNATWQTNVYGNGMISLAQGATFNTGALHLTGKDYSGRDNTDADRVGKPATIVVDAATLNVGKVKSDNGSDYSYNSKDGINVGTIDGKLALLDIKNGGAVNFHMANGQTTNFGAGATVNVAASTLKTISRDDNGTVTLANNGVVNVTGASNLNIKNYSGNAINATNTTLADVQFGGAVNAFGTNNISGTSTIGGILSLGYGTNPTEQVVVNITGNFKGTNVLVSTNNGVDNILNVGKADGERTKVHFDQLGAFADVNVANADVTYGYAFIRNDFNANNSTFEIKGGVNTYFSGNAKVVLDNTTWNLSGYANIGSYGGYMYGNADVTLKNGSSMTATNLGIEVSGEKVVKLTLEDNSSLNATKLTNQGTIVLAGEEATLTSNECDNVTTSVANMVVSYSNGKYTLIPAVAKIVETPYASLQDAINAVNNGETITLIADVAENVTVVQAPDVKFTIEGAQKTMNGTITVDGKSNAYATAGVTIKNVKFDATGIAVDACINLGDGTTATRYTNYVTVENCTFTGGNQEKAAIKSYQGGDKNLTVTGCTTVDNTMHSLIQAANIAGVVVDDCIVKSKNGINLNSSSNVKIMNSTIEVSGYAVRAGVSGGESGKIELTNNTLKTNGSEDAVVVIRGTASKKIDLTMTENVVSGTTHISGTTEETKISADANYWDGKAAPVVNGTLVEVNSYYSDAALENLVTVSMTLAQFVEKVIEGDGAFDGINIKGEKVTVKLEPASGDARTRTATDINVPNRLQKYSNPEVYYAQYQRFAELTNVNISNVDFVFVPAAITVQDAWNPTGATTTTDNIYGELQLLNTGSVSFTNCSFDKMSVSPFKATALNIVECSFEGLGAYAIKDVIAGNVTITSTEFTNCNGGFWFANAPQTIIVQENTFTGIGRRGAIQFSATGDYTETVMTITGNEVKDNAAFLWQLNNTVSSAQIGAILDTNNNTYQTAYVDGSLLFVVEVETTQYYTLQEAFNAGGEVVVLRDITLTETATIAAGKEVVLDLNGKTISMVYAKDATANHTMILNNGNLTITGAGTLSYEYTGADLGTTYYANTVTTAPGSVLTVMGGTIVNNTYDKGVIAYAIDGLTNGNGGDVTVNIEGGDITSKRQALRIFTNSTTNTGALNISGGVFTGRVIVQNASVKANKAALNITGGTFNANAYKTDVLYVGGSNSATIDIQASVSGGTFNGEITNTNVKGFITGGTFTMDVNEYCHKYYDAFEGANGIWTIEQVLFAQTTSLNRGWNWYSSYINLSSDEGLVELQNALDGKGIEIKGKTGFTDYHNNSWSMTEDFIISAKQMYMIKTTEAVEIMVDGVKMNPAVTPITLRTGWNWIGYPVDGNLPINVALAGLGAENGDVIKDRNFKAEYSSEINEETGKPLGWIGTLKTMIPGQGYMYKSNKGTSTYFTYSTNVEGAKYANENITSDNNYWAPEMSQYANNMTITAMLNIDGNMVKDNYEIAAFANGECRGSARPIYIEGLNAYMLFMTVFGEDVEELTFKCYDINNETEYELNNRVNYSDDANLGSIDEPYMFFMNTLGVEESTLDMINIYPNPTTRDRAINLQATCDNVEVFNALGVKVAEYQNVDTIDALETAGVYVIRVTINGEVKNCRLVVE